MGCRLLALYVYVCILLLFVGLVAVTADVAALGAVVVVGLVVVVVVVAARSKNIDD